MLPALVLAAAFPPTSFAATHLTASQAAWVAQGVLIQQARHSGKRLTRARTGARCQAVKGMARTFKCSMWSTGGSCTGTVQVYEATGAGYKTRLARVRCR